MQLRFSGEPPRVVVAFPQGVLDVTVAPEFRIELLALANDGNQRIVVDLSDVEAIDSSCLGALIDGLKAIRKQGGDLLLANPSAHVASMIELAKLGGILKVVGPSDRATE